MVEKTRMPWENPQPPTSELTHYLTTEFTQVGRNLGGERHYDLFQPASDHFATKAPKDTSKVQALQVMKVQLYQFACIVIYNKLIYLSIKNVIYQ